MVTPFDNPHHDLSEAVSVDDESPGPEPLDDGSSGAEPVAAGPVAEPLDDGSAGTELVASGPVAEAPGDRPPPTAERSRDPAVASVERIRGRLAELDELPVDQHVEVYEDLHAQLTAALRAVNSATNPGQGG